MSRYLLIHHSAERGEVRFELEPGATYRVGAKGDNDLVIPDNDVSRHHAILRVGDGVFHITDLNSKNGTFVNGVRVSDATVRCGDLISLSSAKLVVVEVSSGAYAMVPDAVGDDAPGAADPSEDTNAQTVVVPTEELIGLFEDVADGMTRGALAAPLAWAVSSLAVEAALLLYADHRGDVSLLTSAGDLGPWTTEGGALAGVVREHAPVSPARTGVRRVSALGDELLVSRVDGHHVLVLRCGSVQPPLAEVRAVVIATALALRAGHVGRPHGDLGGGLDTGAISGFEAGALVGPSSGMAAVRSRISELASSDMPIAVVGEPGVGRRAVARAVHRERTSDRAPAVEVVCDPSVIDALCGRGGTGAVDISQPWDAARGGSLILLEGERLPLDVWRRVLDRASRTGDGVHILMTWRECSNRVDEPPPGVRRLRVPALRERREDIPVLVSRWAEQRGSAAWTAACLEAMATYDWPDNLRELHAEVMRIHAVRPSGRAVDVADLAPRIRVRATGAALNLEALRGGSMDDARRRFEAWFVSAALQDNDGNQTRTAEQLGLSRAGLFRKLRRLGVGGHGAG